MIGALFIIGFILLYIGLLGLFVRSRHLQLKEECSVPEDSSRSIFLHSLLVLKQPCIWGNAVYLALLIGTILNINGIYAVEKEVSFSALLHYLTDCAKQVFVFYLIPFCVASGSGFLALMGKKNLFSLTYGVFRQAVCSLGKKKE